MSDRPYTDDELRTEAARQHVALTEDPDFVGVGEQMDDQTWRSLSEDDFDAAQRSIHDLINGAADVSEWAVNLGADGLEPDEHTIQLGAKGTGPDDPEMPFVRLHFAFHPTATAEERDRFVMQLSKAIANAT